MDALHRRSGVRVHINKLSRRKRQQDDPFRSTVTDPAKKREKCLRHVAAWSLMAIKTRS